MRAQRTIEDASAAGDGLAGPRVVCELQAQGTELAVATAGKSIKRCEPYETHEPHGADQAHTLSTKLGRGGGTAELELALLAVLRHAASYQTSIPRSQSNEMKDEDAQKDGH
jgi:hypothetical protein